MSKWMYMFGAMLIAGFAVLGVMEMQSATTPYVTTVAKARALADKPIQFKGAIVRGKTSYDDSSHELLFTLRDDKGETIRARYNGIKPGNFDTADVAVVRGTYRDGELSANQLLLKCPSKYKGQ